MLRWIAVRLVVIALALVACEGAARGVYLLAAGRPIDLSAVDDRRRHLAAEGRALDAADPGTAARDGRIPHPYLGVVGDPARAGEDGSPPSAGPSAFGFRDDKVPVLPASEDDVIVGILGGTMAGRVSRDGLDALVAELARVPVLRERRIVPVRLALDGGKEPQQLIALAWLLSLGAHFDALVTLDGFEEVAMPMSANLPRDVHPSFPSAWPDVLGRLEDPALARHVGEIAAITRIRGWWAELFDRPVLGASALGTLLWRAGDDLLAQRAVERRVALAAARGQFEGTRDHALRGPPPVRGDEGTTTGELVRIWVEATAQVAALCRANGIRCLNALQPSPYFPGSKPMAADERRLALREDGAAARAVRDAYPLMRDAAPELERRGVVFLDLTGAFEGHEAPIYVDADGGINGEGARILGRRIGEALARLWPAAPPPRPAAAGAVPPAPAPLPGDPGAAGAG